MSPAEIRVLNRLSARCNVLPVIARADSLTDDRLEAVKEAIRKGLDNAGLDFGVFGPQTKKRPEEETPKRRTRFSTATGGTGNADDSSELNGTGEESESDEERKSRPVIKLRAPRHRALSRSRSRRDLSQAADDDRRPMTPDVGDRESIANVRFSAQIVAQVDFGNVMPFALIAPEMGQRKHRHKITDSEILSTAPSSPMQQSEDGHASSEIPETPMSTARLAYLNGPPDDLRGVFTRKFRWGTVDVLNPDHCDFAALRTAVMSTHLKVFLRYGFWN